MRIGLITQLHGRPDGDTPAPTWGSIRKRATTAVAVGFDMFVFEDALLYRGEKTTNGVWGSVSIAAAVAARGCRVPECVRSQGFECPCHGSKYNIHGEYAAGPAPRNIDRFAASTNEAGELIIDTSTIVETSRSKTYTANYHKVPSACEPALRTAAAWSGAPLPIVRWGG